MPSEGNVSSAVRQQRIEPNDSLDDFPTPPWAVRAVCRYIARHLTGTPLGDLTAREPCANRGHMLRVCQEYFAEVDASDVHDYGLGLPVRDFLFPEPLKMVDWTLMNPPFRLASEFIDRALDTSKKGVVVIVRSAFLEGEKRFERLFNPTPPDYILQFSERVVMLRGRLVQAGKVDPLAQKPGTKASTASVYCALIYSKDRYTGSTIFDWLEPCRRELEVAGDYPDPPDGLATLHHKTGVSDEPL